MLWILLVALCLATCLVFTHSRSGVAATAVAAGAALVMATRRPAVWSVILVAGGGLVIGSAYLTRPDAFSAALRSLAYRLEYWQSTWAMIQDYPAFGCGPGQYQDTYTAYKLPAASEEVADPHNFLLEIAATGGLAAATFFVASIALAAWQILQRLNGPPGGREEMEKIPGRRTASHAYAAVAGGTLLGLIAAWLDGIPLPTGHAILFAAAAAVPLWILHPWVRAGTMPRLLPAVAAGGLLLHLTVSGGIGEPALAIPFWLLLAVQLDAVPPRDGGAAAEAFWRLRIFTRKQASVCGLVLALALLTAAYVTYYRPVLRASNELTRADTAGLLGRDEAQSRAVRAAVEADPWSIDAARRMASLRFSAWEDAPSAEALTAWTAADARARRLAPRRHWVWRESAERFAAVFEKAKSDEPLQRALAHARRTIELYPNYADHHLFYAELLVRAARHDEAARAIETARELDRAQQAAGHTEKTLPAERREVLRGLADRLSESP
jgi:hypothetical protein